MAQNTLKRLYLDELRDIYDAEKQLIKSLPEMSEAATSEELRSGFEKHLEQTKEHARRLEQIFSELGEKPTGKKCKSMQGPVAEGSEMIEEDFEGDVKDAGLIAAAQCVERYEISAYGTVRNFASVLGEQNAAALLEKTLNEEKETDEKPTEFSDGIKSEAASYESEEQAEEGSTTNTKAKAARPR